MTASRLLFRHAPFWGLAFISYLFLLSPFVVLAVASLEGGDAFFFSFPPRTLSIAGYLQIPLKYYEALWTSFLLATLAAVFATIIGATAAIGLVRRAPRFNSALQTIFRLPLQIPFMITGIVFLQFYYQIAPWIGFNISGTFVGLLMAHVFVCIPFSFGSVAAVLVNMSISYEEAAQICGASSWRTLTRVTLPLTRNGLFAGLLYAFITSFGDVPIATFLAGSGYVTFPVEIFQTMIFDFNRSLLPVSTLVVLFSVLLIAALQRFAGLDTSAPTVGRS